MALHPPFGVHTIAKVCDWGRMAVESGRDTARPLPTYKYQSSSINLGYNSSETFNEFTLTILLATGEVNLLQENIFMTASLMI